MKKPLIILTGLLAGLSLSACGGDTYFPELTEEETALITEYAVDVVMKHSRGTDYRLLENAEEQVRKKRERDAAIEAARQKKAEEEAQAQAEEGSSEGGEGEAAEPVMPSVSSVSELLGLDGVSIEWMGYEVTGSYVQSGGFSMDASPGKALVVLNFYTENTSGEEKYVDVTQIAPVFRIGINDGHPKVVQTTMLSNDLNYFRGSLSPGVSQELVLVQEVRMEEAESLVSVSLTGEVNGTEYSLGER